MKREVGKAIPIHIMYLRFPRVSTMWAKLDAERISDSSIKRTGGQDCHLDHTLASRVDMVPDVN